jgi:hypothetical protein
MNQSMADAGAEDAAKSYTARVPELWQGRPATQMRRPRPAVLTLGLSHFRAASWPRMEVAPSIGADT